MRKQQAKHVQVTICLTVLNEAENIGPIVAKLPRLAPHQEILFVDGHSLDGTVRNIRDAIKTYPQKHIRLLTQPNFGQADAIRFGFIHARGEYIILFEGDGTADPQDLTRIYKEIKRGALEFIEGSRFQRARARANIPFINRLGNWLFACWFSFLLNQPLTDVLGGIKAISKKNFSRINKFWGTWGTYDPFGDFELLFGAAHLGLTIGEVPMHSYKRQHGSSKTKVLVHGMYLLKMAIRGYYVLRQSKV